VGCGAADVLPGRPRLRRGRLVGQLGLVHLQRAAHGLAVLVRRSATRRRPGRAADSETSARTTLGAADEHTTVVPDLHPTQAAPELAWSAEPEPEPEPDPGPPLLLQANRFQLVLYAQ
jgi:hypothetical protein